MATPTNIQDHGWLAMDNLSDCAANMAYWIGQVATPGGEVFTADAVTTVPVTIEGFSSAQTGNLLNLLQNSGGSALFEFTTAASAVDGLKFGAVATTGTPTITAFGTDTNVPMQLAPKGTGTVTVVGGAASGPSGALTVAGVSSAVNGVTVTNAATTTNPVISVTGSDTNIGLTLTPKGSGLLNYNVSTVAAGTGVTGTLNRIGGSGPATGLQNAWIPVQVAGTNMWIPGWE